MKEEFRSILLEDFPIQWPGSIVHRVALNQHMPRIEKFSEHQHEVAQALLYLRGYGTQHLGEKTIPIERGSLVIIPSGTRHRFEKSGHRRPVCLAIDFESPVASDWKSETRLPDESLKEVEASLVALNEEESNAKKSSIQIASLILQMLALLEQTAADNRTTETGPVTASVRRAVQRESLETVTPGGIAKLLDRSLDHLNRQLRSECGTTVGGIVNQVRLDRSYDLLKNSDRPISDVASEIGMDDQNYFSRWFRQRTGQTPTGWRAAMQ